MNVKGPREKNQADLGLKAMIFPQVLNTPFRFDSALTGSGSLRLSATVEASLDGTRQQGRRPPLPWDVQPVTSSPYCECRFLHRTLRARHPTTQGVADQSGR